jgi:hypothetical protein
METTINSKTNEKYDETFQSANKWMNEMGSAMFNIYNRQLNLAFDFYRNLFNSFSSETKTSAENKTNGTNHSNFVPPFLNPGSMFSTLFRPFKMDGNSNNVFSSQYENMDRQANEFTTGMINTFQKEIQQTQRSWSEWNEKCSSIAEDSLRANQDLLNTMAESYFRQINSLMELNKKLFAESGRQFGSFVKQTERNGSDKTGETAEKSETEVKTENKFVPSKKQTVNS